MVIEQDSRQKTLLVTGATGFLGSHLVKALIANHYEVIILKRSFSDTWRIDEILPKTKFYNTDQCSLVQPFQEFQIDAVIHTATDYGRGQNSISQILESNILFPLQLLELGAQFGSKLFINTDTFFNKASSGYQYLNNYSRSKKQFIEWSRQVCSQRPIRFVNLRLEHVFGSKDSDSKFVTCVIKNCLANTPDLKLTLGNQTRDFVYVDDVIAAYLQLLQHQTQIRETDNCQDYDVGTGHSITVRKFVECIHQLAHSKTQLQFGALPYRDGEIMHSQADIAKLEAIGWRKRWSLPDALTETINWYSRNMDVRQTIN